MRNTLALAAILLGAVLVYSGYKGWTFADTIRFFIGQEQKDVDAEGNSTEQDNDDDLEIPDLPLPIPGNPFPQVPIIPTPDIPNPFGDVIPGNPVPEGGWQTE